MTDSRRSPRRTGFPFLGSAASTRLVLGSLPGEASLRAGAYYAHPRNAFWTLMAPLIGAAPDAPYPERVKALLEAGIALWDVLAGGRRRGSLDADIDPASISINDFPSLFMACPGIRRVLCNGSTAYTLYRRKVAPALPAPWRDLPVVRLPSSSPAHAGMTRADKGLAWTQAFREP